MEMEESSPRKEECVYLSVPRGGPIYVPNLVGPLTRVPHFESSVFSELESLKQLLCSDSSQSCDDDRDLDISVDELKVFTEEELVDMAMKEAFKEEGDAQNLSECSLKQCDGGSKNDPGTSSKEPACFENSGRGGSASVPLKSNISPPESGLENSGMAGALIPIESSNGIPSGNGRSKVPSKKISNKRKKAKLADEDAYIAKVEQLAKIKQKQDEEKAAAKLHSFNATCKINDSAITSSERTERMQSLRSTNTAIKVKSSSLNEHRTVRYPEVLLCVEVYHNKKTWLKTQEFLILGQQSLTELRDGIYCSTDLVMQKAEQHDPSGYFLIEDAFYNDMRDPSAIDYSEPILEWLRDSKEDALRKWECITSGELQKKQKEVIGNATDLHLPRFQALDMHKTRFCDLRFRLGAGYLYCHQGDCKHTMVIRDMRLIHAEDVNNRAAYPIVIFQKKLRIHKCFVCKIARAEKVTVDDKWAPENPCYFCKNCYFLLHYSMDGSLLYTDFSVYDYNHD